MIALLDATQHVDLDVYLDAKEKFGVVGAKWAVNELTKVNEWLGNLLLNLEIYVILPLIST